MPAMRHNLVIEQGATYVLAVKLTDHATGDPYVVPSDAEVRMQIRNRQGQMIMAEASTTHGGITHSPGVLRVELSAEDTSMMPYASGKYDIEMQHGEYVVRILDGDVEVRENITQEPGEPVLR